LLNEDEIRPALESNLASCPVSNGGSYRRVKRAGREADHSPPSSAEIKIAWSYTSTLQIRLQGMVLN